LAHSPGQGCRQTSTAHFFSVTSSFDGASRVKAYYTKAPKYSLLPATTPRPQNTTICP
jgi:hypothetical protein